MTQLLIDLSIKPLRICKRCEFKVWTTKDLEKFKKCNTSRYGRKNICLECHSKYNKEWRRKNPEKVKLNNQYVIPRKITFNNKRVLLKKNPRTNICSVCNRSYPKDLKKQTTFHHWFYDSADILAGTIELCNSCHSRLPYTRWVEPCKGENGTIVKYDANLFKACPKCGEPNPIWDKEKHKNYIKRLRGRNHYFMLET